MCRSSRSPVGRSRAQLSPHTFEYRGSSCQLAMGGGANGQRGKLEIASGESCEWGCGRHETEVGRGTSIEAGEVCREARVGRGNVSDEEGRGGGKSKAVVVARRRTREAECPLR